MWLKNCLKRANKPKLTSLTTAKTKFSHRRQNFFLSLRSELNKLYKFPENRRNIHHKRRRHLHQILDSSVWIWTILSHFERFRPIWNVYFGRFRLILDVSVRFRTFPSNVWADLFLDLYPLTFNSWQTVKKISSALLEGIQLGQYMNRGS